MKNQGQPNFYGNIVNKPYVKQFDGENKLVNSITKESPFSNIINTNRRARRAVGKYTILNHPLTGEYMGKLRVNGNNRANTSSRTGVDSRMN